MEFLCKSAQVLSEVVQLINNRKHFGGAFYTACCIFFVLVRPLVRQVKNDRITVDYELSNDGHDMIRGSHEMVASFTQQPMTKLKCVEDMIKSPPTVV
jgi:hypothetical protein